MFQWVSSLKCEFIDPLSETGLMERDDIFAKTNSTYKAEAVKEALKLQWRDDKTRINDEAAELMLELTRKLAVEIAMRSANQARIQDEFGTKVELQHVEKIIPQILLDF